MKILKYVLFAILALVVLFFALGLFKSTVSYGHEITVDKPVQEAWAVTQDESKYGQWLEGFKSMELIEGEPGKVGSKYKVIVQPEGQPDFEMIETVVSMAEYEHVEMHFASEAMDFEQTISFAESDNGTTITSDSKVMGKGIMTRSMFALMGMFGAFQAQEEKNFEALKALINENSTDY
jgi:hypothetical protein